MAERVLGSFRDPGGIVYRGHSGVLLRQINESSLEDYKTLRDSGLYGNLIDQGLLIPHEEVDLEFKFNSAAKLILQPRLVPAISYPYEWCFSQLKDASLTTLKLLEMSLEKGMVLKDASAYNVQFLDGRPVFIDTLSFEPYIEGEPWIAYGQFCRHFLAPLALMAHVDIRLGLLLRNFIDGIPLDLASHLLPGVTKLNPGLAMHLHMHAKSTTKLADKKVEKKGAVNKNSFLGLIDSLQGTIRGLSWKPQGTEWGDYYSDTNYTDSSMEAKRRLVDEFLGGSYESVWDFGANTGEFSKIAARHSKQVVAWDIDPAAVEKHYLTVGHDGPKNVLPLLLDLANPSPALGWACSERESVLQRGPVGAILALALVHHLAIGNNVPLPDIASFFAKVGELLVIEFVPKEDSQVQRLLANREDIFDQYNVLAFEEAFQKWFKIQRRELIPGSLRTLYRMEKL